MSAGSVPVGSRTSVDLEDILDALRKHDHQAAATFLEARVAKQAVPTPPTVPTAVKDTKKQAQRAVEVLRTSWGPMTQPEVTALVRQLTDSVPRTLTLTPLSAAQSARALNPKRSTTWEVQPVHDFQFAFTPTDVAKSREASMSRVDDAWELLYNVPVPDFSDPGTGRSGTYDPQAIASCPDHTFRVDEYAHDNDCGYRKRTMPTRVFRAELHMRQVGDERVKCIPRVRVFSNRRRSSHTVASFTDMELRSDSPKAVDLSSHATIDADDELFGACEKSSARALSEERPASPMFGSASDLKSDAPRMPSPAFGMESSEDLDEHGKARYLKEYSWGDRRRHRHNMLNRKAQTSSLFKYPADGAFFKQHGDVFDVMNLRVLRKRTQTGLEQTTELALEASDIIAGRYKILHRLGEAAFSRTVCCLDLETEKTVCLKVINNTKESFDQSLDEISILRYLHDNVDDVSNVFCLQFYDYFYTHEHLIIVTEVLGLNLYEHGKVCKGRGERYFTMGRIQRIAFQVLYALVYVHSLGVVHADLKPENILVKNEVTAEVRLIDFGSSCFIDDHLATYLTSRSYRAPEVIFGLPFDAKIDLWALGCILAELWTGYVLFNIVGEHDGVGAMLARVYSIVGEFPFYMVSRGANKSILFTEDGQLFQVEDDGSVTLFLPKLSSLRQRLRTDDHDFVDLIQQLLTVDPAKRLSAAEALNHPFFKTKRYSDGIL